MAIRRRQNRNHHARNTNLRLLPPLESRTPLRQLLDEDSYLADAARDLVLCVGGVDELESLHPEEYVQADFAWDSVPKGQQRLVLDIIDATMLVESEYLGTELDDAVLTLIGIAAANPAEPLKRRTSPKRLAAALTWIVLAGNQQFSSRCGHTATGLWSQYGVTSCVELGQSIAKDLEMWASDIPGITDAPPNTVFLANPSLLCSDLRFSLMEIRDDIVEVFEAELLAREEAKPLSVTPSGALVARAVHVEVTNAFVGDSDLGERIVVALTDQDDNLEMISLSAEQANRLVACVTEALTSSGLAS